MRINSYNKFFAEVAKIMNTSVKSVKQLDGRYKVELANHVYLNVYRGVSGSLFIHDHRGISHITSCYDFEDFKTMKDLYERLVSDYSESAKKEVMEVKQELNARFGKETNEMVEKKQNKYPHLTSAFWCFPTISEMYNDTCFCCPADRQGNRCCGKQWCKQTWERYAAIVNPEWHHVSLATLANIDFDMFDEKRRVYFSLYREWKETLKNLRKCSGSHSYERCYANFRQAYITAFQERKISKALVMYFDKQVSMANVECGIWSSAVEVAMGRHESRKYNSAIIRS